jgi:type IV secretion system protein VirD4
LTIRTAGRPVKAAPQKPPKPQGRLSLAAKRKREHAARAVAPYAAGAAVAAVADLTLHQPELFWLGLGAVAMHAGIRLHESYGWHRSGGKAAMRQRRKYQGTATRRELARNLSPAAARKRAALTCADLDPAAAGVPLGRARGQDIAGTYADSYLVIAPPQTVKTALIAGWAMAAPGALLATSSRIDLYLHTVIPRTAFGKVWVLNPDGDGGIPSTFAWSPLDGCQDSRTAIRRAGILMAAAPSDKGGKDAYWDGKSADLLRLMLHAGALAGVTMREVYAWVRDPAASPAAVILAGEFAEPGWAQGLEALCANEEQLGHVVSGAAGALRWMDDRAMASAACPAGDGFDFRAFAEDGTGTVYLIGADAEHGSVAPYFAAAADEMFEQARQAAARNGGRLARPLTLALDEAATIVPVPLHKWTSVAAGYNITVIAGIQALSQMPARWGEHDAKTIRTNFTVKVIGGGFTDEGELESLSSICGMRDTWDHVKAPDGGKTKQPRQERLFPPERIRMLRQWHVLVVHRNTRPVEAVIKPVWDLPGYQKADLAEAFSPYEVPMPAITSGRLGAIPMPPAPPSAVERAAPVPELSSPVLTPGPCEEAVPSWHDHAATSA